MFAKFQRCLLIALPVKTFNVENANINPYILCVTKK